MTLGRAVWEQRGEMVSEGPTNTNTRAERRHFQCVGVCVTALQVRAAYRSLADTTNSLHWVSRQKRRKPKTLAICMSVPIWKLRNDETIVSKRMKKRDALINLQVKMWEQRGSDQEGFHHVRSYRKQTCQITPKNHQKSPGQTQGWSL